MMAESIVRRMDRRLLKSNPNAWPSSSCLALDSQPIIMDILHSPPIGLMMKDAAGIFVQEEHVAFRLSDDDSTRGPKSRWLLVNARKKKTHLFLNWTPLREYAALKCRSMHIWPEIVSPSQSFAA